MNDSYNKNNDNSCVLPIDMCTGIAVGAAIGAATHNIGLWMPIGLSVGICLGLLFGRGGEDDGGDGSNQ